MEERFVSLNSRYIVDDSEGKKTYKKNGVELLNENNEKIDENAFKDLIKREVSDFIHQNYSNIIVLVGAGASVFCTETGVDSRFGKTVFMLAQLINDELKHDPSSYSLQELSNFCKYDVPVELEENGKKLRMNPLFNLEDFLSDLLSFEKYVPMDNRKRYEYSKHRILGLIVSNTSYGYDKSCLKHAAFINTVAQLVKTPSKLTMVTTNYDTLIEDAADSIEYTIIDGFTFSYRPHFDSDMFEWNLVRDIENLKTREIEYKKNIINLLKLHGSLTWERCGKDILRKEKRLVTNPLMIFPSSNKYIQSYQEPYFELFTKFQELLKRPNTLLITAGFSFADNHIAQMIIQAVLHNKGLAVLISDYDINQTNENWEKMDNLMKHNYHISFLKATMNSDLTDYLGGCYVD